MAMYLSVLTQELVHNRPIVKQNVILSTLYTTFVAPITHALGLTYANPNDLYKFYSLHLSMDSHFGMP